MKHILFIILLQSCYFLSAQTLISGKITDAKTGENIPYVTITSDNGNSTSADDEGFFSIETTSGSSLYFSAVGYTSKTLILGEEEQIKVLLQPSTTQLDQVVITALGVKRNHKELGYTVQRIEAKDVNEVKAVNFLDNLSGKIAGITVTPGATGVGSSSKITIRGEASFSNNNPLFIVDGTPINNTTVFNTTNEKAEGFQEIDFGNGAMEVNPDDIASVTVLKGPTAAALYGTRASNGVIVIETKTGKTDPGVSFNSSLFFDTAFKLPEFQNQYGQGNSGEFEFVDGLGGGINDNISYSWGPRLDAGILLPQFNSPVTLPNGTLVRGGDTSLYNGLPITPTPFVSYPNNIKNFYKTGITRINNIAIGNSFSKGSYRLSITDLQSESIIPGVDLNRQTVATKLHFKPTEKTQVNAAVNYVHSGSKNRPSNGYGSENVNYALVAWGPRSLNIDSLKEYWQPGLENTQQYSFNYTFFDNPYLTLLENRNSFNRDRVFGNISVKQLITDNLSVSLRTGLDYSNEKRQFRRAFSSNRFSKGGYAEHDVMYREINTDFLITYSKVFKDFSANISFGGNRLSQKASTKQSQTIGLAQPGIYNFNNAASPIDIFQFESEKRINSLYGVAHLSYKDFLFVDITGRNDWSSALATPFSADQTSFFYPSVSSGFILSNVVKLPKIISYTKLRASVAQVGNDTQAYQTGSTFVSKTPYKGETTYSHQNFIPNQNLKPEQTTSYEIGLDIHFFADRLNFDFTYFNAFTENQIISLPIPISSGYDQNVVNGGGVRSNGMELVSQIIPVKNKDFQWQSTFNFGTYKATVEDLPQEDGRLTLAYSRIYDSNNQTVWFQVEKGGQIGDLYGNGYLRNENGDFIIDTNGNYIADSELKKLGNYNPDFTLGWNNSFQYKKWNLNFLFDWHQGGELISRTQALGAVGGQLKETSYRPESGIVAEGVVNVGTNDNPVYEPNTTAIVAERYYRQFYDRNYEENNVYDASFLKLRQFSIGYSFPLKKGFLGLKNEGRISIALVGRNLFAISAIPHFDPEQLAVQGTTFLNGVEDMSYATTRSIGYKLNVNF